MNRNIVVIGASSGGVKSISEILASLPKDFPGSIFIVLHLHPQGEAESLLKKFNSISKLICKFPYDGEPFIEQTVYIAPPDHHMLLSDGKILVTQGPKENRYRPCIDTLFRSAASNYNSRVIGIILSGMLNDGNNGLGIIKKCGGLTIVQLPEDAEYQEMPLNALKNIPDYELSAKEIGALLPKLITEPVIEVAVNSEIRMESQIAERVIISIEAIGKIGTPMPYSCPDCGGALWEVDHGGIKKIRCQIGHAYSPEAFMSAHVDKIEETLWVSLRMMEERHHMLSKMAEEEMKKGRDRAAATLEGTAGEVKVHIERLREILYAHVRHKE